MFRLRPVLTVLTALLLLGGLVAPPAGVVVAKTAGWQHRTTASAPSLLVAFDSDDDGCGGFEQPAFVGTSSIAVTTGPSPAVANAAVFRAKGFPGGDQRPFTLVGTIVLLI